MPRPLQFRVYEKGQNVLSGPEHNVILEWRQLESGFSKWLVAEVKDSQFVTKEINTRYQTELKIYRRHSNDTMFISCFGSLLHIPFQQGHYTLDRNTGYLANMQTFNGVRILNQDWRNFKDNNPAGIPLLRKKRFSYFRLENSPFEEMDEPGVIYAGFTSSEHLKETPADGSLTEYITLGKLYSYPPLSSSVYCIGYVNNVDDEEEGPSQYFLESADGCRSWKVRFPLTETNAELISFNGQSFTFAIEYPRNQLLKYNMTGRIIDSLYIDEAPCDNPLNKFYPCEKALKGPFIANAEYSDPMMDNDGMFHLYHKAFTNNGTDIIRIEELPFYPKTLSRSYDDGQNWRTIMATNAGDTYAYLTMRKNKLVLLSYNYTMVSLDFGQTWTFFRNGAFTGGEWNFIWLDDNTLVNVTTYYADVMYIN